MKHNHMRQVMLSFLGCWLMLWGARSQAVVVPVYGLNDTNDFGPTCPVTCQGMPEWFVTEPYCNLWVKDIPLGYRPAKGPAVALQLAYKLRDEGSGLSTNEFSFGRAWNSDWRSFARPLNNGAQVFMPGGGAVTYGATNSFEFYTGTRLECPAAGEYRVVFPDGRTNVYAMTAIVDGVTNIYLTEISDRTGQKLTLGYDQEGGNPGVARLRRVIDADGRTNQLTYSGDIATNFWNQPPSSFSTNLVVRVVDGFGRETWFDHDSAGQLTRIRDVQGLESAFSYAANGWLTRLVTPYGTNVFNAQEVATNGYRALTVTDAGGGHHLWVYRKNLSELALTPPTMDTDVYSTTFDTRFYTEDNSFYWGPRQHAFLTHTNDPYELDTAEYGHARRQHWLGVGANTALSMVQEFSPDGTNPGQRTWYDYAFTGGIATQLQPLLTATVLPNDETAFVRTERLANGNVTNQVSTWCLPDGTRALRTNQFVFSADGVDLLESYDASGQRTAGISYSNHLPVVATNVLGELTRYTHNAAGQLTSVSNAAGLLTTNLYFTTGDYTGWLQSTVDIATGVPQRTNRFTYTNGLVYTHTNERGRVTTNTWDALGRLTSASDGLGTVSHLYDKLDLVRTVDRMGFTNGFVFDAMRRLTDRFDALGRHTHYEYCTCSALESVTDALTNTTTFTYDAGGRPTGVYGPDNYWQTNELNLLGQVNSTTDSAGTSVTNHYNNQGLIYAVSNAWGQVSYAEFDIHDRVTLAVDANHVTVTNAYDVAGRLRATGTPANGALQSYGYTLNVAGPTSYTNALTNVMLMAYDAYGRKTNEISGGAAGGTFAALTTNRFAYDPDGALRELTDGNQHQTRWQYDHYGRLTNKLDHLNTSAFAYGYDANSRLTSRTTPAKGTTTYGHDAVGNLTSVDYPVSADLILQYDALNRLTNLVTANTFTNSFTYTAAGLLESEDGPWANDTVSYSYTNRLRTGLALNSQPATLNLSYAWDSTKRLTNITAQAGAFGYDYVVGQASRLSRVRLPGGASITNAFDTLARMTDTHYVNPGGAVLNAHGYGLNPGNQRTSQNRMGPGYTNSVDYGYDPLGQLTTALGTEADATPRLHEQFGYQYDPAGNLKYRTNNALVQTFKVDALNQLTNVSRTGTLTVSGNTSTKATNVTVNGQSANLYADLLFATDGFTPTDGTNTFTAIAQSANGVADTNTLSSYLPAENAFTFDANGNLTFDGQKAFEYDDENQLVRVTQTNVFKTEFSYDGKMRLREKREFDGSGTLQSETRYVYDGMLLIQERDGSNTPLVSYTRGRDLSGSFAGAGGIGGLLARSDHTQTSALLKTAFYHADGNGNITALLSTNGLVVAWYQYAPFGATLAMSGPLASANTHRFSSKLWHERSGLYYYGYRFYEPNLQRWLTKDPIREAGGINLYGFVGNGPMVALDALGLAEAGVLTKPLIDPLVSIGKGIMAIVGIGGDAVAELAYPTPKEITETEMYAQRGLIAPWYDPGPVVDSSIDPRWFEVAEGAGNALLLYLPCKALAPAKGTRLGSSVAPAPEGTGNFVNLASPQRTTHILTGDATGGGHLWPGLPGKTPFPQGWSGDKVMHCVSDIATDPGLQWVQQTGKAGSLFTKAGDPARFIVIGEREAVRIKVVLEPAGEGIITAHPLP